MRVLLAVVVCFAAGACSRCGPNVVPIGQCEGVNGVQADHTDSCATSSECADHFTCQAVSKDNPMTCCTFQDRKCATEADCCPGQTCASMSNHKCFDKFLQCDVDADCGDTGNLKCQTYTDTYGTSKRCRYAACGSLGECPDGQSCFQGECLATLPCGGHCDSGLGCVPEANYCQDYKDPVGRTQAACPMTCMPGFIATFKDNTNIWDTCKLPPVACVCAELPGIRSEDLGRFSSIALDPGKALWVSMYDGQYGNLAVDHFDTTGKLVKTEYVDGVPATGTITYGPSGARGGVADPGDDVGRYTDIAVGANGIVYVSYYDVTNGNLRFAYRTTDATWTTMRVDGDNADLGLYTSVALDETNVPSVSYFQRGGAAQFNASDCPAPIPTGPKDFITALKYARAASPTPGAGDWTIKTLACLSAPTPACYQCSNTCADPGTGPACLMTASNCVKGDAGTGCDANTEACVMVGTTPTCAKKYNPSTVADIPQGVGMFSAMAINGKDAFIAYMRRQVPMGATLPDGDLYGIHIDASGTPGAPVLLDGSGDTGFFPDVKIDPTTKHVAVSYNDFTSKALKFYTASAFQAGVTPEIIDPGTGTSGSGTADWEGTDSALVYGTAATQVYAVYQDPTTGDLKLAKRAATWVVQPPIMTMGAVGFFADGVFDNGKIYASHARVHAKLISGEPHVDNALLLNTVDPAP